MLRNISSADVVLRRSGNDLIIFQDANDRKNGVTLKNYFTQNASTRLENIYFEKDRKTVALSDYMSSIKNIISGKGTIYGTDADEDFNITAGGSTVYSSAGWDEVHFNKTGKNKFIDPSDSTAPYINTALYGLTGTDTIGVVTLTGGFSAYGDGLEFNVVSGRTISIGDFWDNPNCLDTTILYNSGFSSKVRDFMNDYYNELYENGGNITLNNTWDRNVYALKAATITGGTSDVTTNIYTGNGNDSITVSHGENYIYTHGGNDTININGGTQNYIIPGEGHKKINISGGDGNMVSLWEGTATIKITGGVNDIYFSNSDNEAYIYGGTNNIELNEGNYLGVYDGNNAITFSSSCHSLVVNGGINTIYGSEGDDTITALGGVNTFYGNPGDDIIYGNPNGGNYFCYGEGDGWDVVYTGHGENIKADTLKFYANLNDLSMQFDGNDALVWYNESEYVRVKDFLDSEYDDINYTNPSNIWVEDSSGKRCRLSDLYIRHPEYPENTTWGTIYSDYLTGTDLYADTLFGGLGNDTICYDSLKNDSMYGGEGENLYKFLYASGAETNPNKVSVYSTSGKDTIYVKNPTKNDFVRNGSDLVISTSVEIEPNYHDFVDIYIKDWFNNPVDISYNNSDTTVSVLDKVKQMGLSGITIGTENGDTVGGVSDMYIARGGNDSITATGASTIFGGAGNDTIIGSDYNDYLCSNMKTVTEGYKYGSYMNNILEGHDGNDYLVAYGEDAILEGGSGDDMYLATLSNNVEIHDYQGNNTLNIKKPDGAGEERAYLVFDVNANGKLVTSYSSMFILNKSSYEYWLSHGSFANAQGEFGGIVLNNDGYSLNPTEKTQAVNFIYDSSENSIDQNKRYALAQEIASWLSEAGCTSVGDVIANGTNQQKSDLIAIFNNFNDTQWTHAAG